MVHYNSNGCGNMDQEKIAKWIKEIRKKHHLTQKQLADRYHVTYQAVSKWENALNMPDISLMKQMSKDFGVRIDEILDGNYETKKKSKIYLWIILLILIIILCIAIMILKPLHPKNDFEFKTLSSECDNFNISGNISYNENKTAIYINHIQYCGGDDKEEYQTIECSLYESHNDMEKKISTYQSTKENITLGAFLKDVILSIGHYEKSCREYQDGTLYLSINATDHSGKTVNYKIPLKLENCPK